MYLRDVGGHLQDVADAAVDVMDGCSPDQDVDILLDEGETITDVTTDAMGFTLDKNGKYAAKYVPFISTTSLRFIKPGIYHYTVTALRGKVSAEGKIIVR